MFIENFTHFLFFYKPPTEGLKLKSHMMYQKSLSLVRTGLFSLVAVCLLASCQNEEELVAPEEAATKAMEASADENGNIETNVSSITVMGENTAFAQNVDCSTCTYVVSKNTDVVDGAALGLKPGSVICLDKKLKYGDLTFVNLAGTEESPITIGNCSGQ